jgi:hypothetical protein
MVLEVILDVFSGRRNPTWIVEGVKAEELMNRLLRLPTLAGEVSPPPPSLGYRGMRMEIRQRDEGEEWAGPYEIYAGLVKDRTTLRKDDSRSFERSLLASAGLAIEPHLKKEILDELDC